MAETNPNNGNQVTRPRTLPFSLGLSENDRLAVHIVYGLYGAAIVFGLPSIFGVILAYLKRGDLEGTALAGHITWQIRTFWIQVIIIVLTATLTATWILVRRARLALVCLPGRQGLDPALERRADQGSLRPVLTQCVRMRATPGLSPCPALLPSGTLPWTRLPFPAVRLRRIRKHGESAGSLRCSAAR